MTTTAFGSFVAKVQAATFTLPIESAAKATGVDNLRDRYGLDGTGITIGVLSDSFATAKTVNTSGNLDTYASNVADNYLPSGIKVLKDYAGTDAKDEGRAILQIIHAVAPGAKLVFHTSTGGAGAFGQGIQALATAGADIIVDDVRYGYPPLQSSNLPLNFSDIEPPNGPINQAITTVVNQGISYFTSAGNGDSPPDGNNPADSKVPDIPIYGHGNNPNALTAGAVYYGNAKSYSNNAFDIVVEQGQLEPFSSEGIPDLLKPDVVAPDGLAISFNLSGGSPVDADSDFYSFFGTSASTPFTAAVAALLLEAASSATPSGIYDALRDTADSPLSGFDSRLGFGLIQAEEAVIALGVEPKPVPEPSATLGLLCVGILIVGLCLKRTQQRSKAIVKPSESLALSSIRTYVITRGVIARCLKERPIKRQPFLGGTAIALNSTNNSTVVFSDR
ncbi:S8 family peptidase [Nostoc sp.]|uniref:S8 family peptidase n=1 Tax=Nostoc sp. TaxID=1180 RepID=UPI002FFD2395